MENPSDEPIIIDCPPLMQKYGDFYHYWKIQTEPEKFPDSRKDKLYELINEFTKVFFKIQRGETAEIEKLTKEFFREMRKNVRNLRYDETGFISTVIDAFNLMHSHINDLQVNTTQDVIKGIQNSCTFMKKKERFLVKDLELNTEISKFLEEMFVTKAFTTDNFEETFFSSSLKDLIVGLDFQGKRRIQDQIAINVRGFEYKAGEEREIAKKTICGTVNDLLTSINCMKLTVFMKAVKENPEVPEAHWEPIYVDYLDSEVVTLKQVVPIDLRHNLITLSLHRHGHLMVISMEDFKTNCLDTLFPGNDTVIASGSVRNSMVLFVNSHKKAFTACLFEEKIHIKSEIQVYDNILSYVMESCFIRCTGEVIILYTPGGLRTISLSKSSVVQPNVRPDYYTNISLSECRHFIILTTKTDVSLFDFNMKLICNDVGHAFFSGVRGNFFETIYIDEDLNAVIKKIKIENLNFNRIPEAVEIDEHVSAEGIRTMNLFVELVGGLFRTNQLNNR